MEKRLHTILEMVSIIFITFILSVTSIYSTFAADRQRLVDEADLLSDSEEKELLYQLNEISERQQLDIVVVTVNSLGELSPAEYADNFYDNHDYGFGEEKDGILFLISMEERDWYISTTGYGITALTDAGRDYMSENFLPNLSAGNYAAAFTTFANLCDDFITQAKMGKPYDVSNFPREPFKFARNFAIAFGIGFIISLIATSIMKSKLKTIRPQSAADIYVKQGGVHLTRKNDLFLYRHVDRKKKPENPPPSNHSGGSRTHTSSSGRTHGGGGGKF